MSYEFHVFFSLAKSIGAQQRFVRGTLSAITSPYAPGKFYQYNEADQLIILTPWTHLI
jgi:hypothetical protein